MQEELSQYAITPDNRLIVISPIGERRTIWGIGEHGFLHGCGSFNKRNKIPRYLINTPTIEEFKRYHLFINNILGLDDINNIS